MRKNVVIAIFGIMLLLNMGGVFGADLFQNWTISTDDGGITYVKLIGGMCNSADCYSINESYVKFYREDAWNCFMQYFNNSSSLESCLSNYVITSPVRSDSKILVRYIDVPQTPSTHYNVYFFGKDYINYVWDAIPYCNTTVAGCYDPTERRADLIKKNNAVATIKSYYVKNMNDVTQPIVINISSEIGAEVCSAFKKINITHYWPPEDGVYIDYSVDTKVHLEIYNQTGDLVYSNVLFQKIPADECYYNYTFVWNPSKTGRYDIRLRTEINDTQIRNPREDAVNTSIYVYNSSSSFCYSRIQNLTVTDENGEIIITEGERTKAGFRFYTAFYLDPNNIEAVPSEIEISVLRANDSYVLNNFTVNYYSAQNGTYQNYETLLGPYQIGQYIFKVKVRALDSRCSVLNNQYEEAVDNFAVVSSDISNDFEAPTTTAVITQTPSASGWYTTDVNVSLVCNDNFGCYRTYYCIDGNNSCQPGTIYSGTIRIDRSGVWYLRFYSVDLKGNRENVKNITIKLDKDAPSVVINTPTYFNEGSAGYIEVNATDSVSGINKTEIYMNNSLVANTSSSHYRYQFTVLENFSYFVKVYDNAGNVYVSPVYNVTINRKPVAVISANPTSGTAPLTVTFSASGSYDPEGDNITYQWDFDNDGTVDATGMTVAHTYSSGTYTAVLKVVDSKGAVGEASVIISVSSSSSGGGTTRFGGGGGVIYSGIVKKTGKKEKIIKEIKLEPVIQLPYLVELELQPNSTVVIYIDGKQYKLIRVGSNGKVSFDLTGMVPGRHVLEIRIGNKTLLVRGFVVFGIPETIYIPSIIKVESNKTAKIRFKIAEEGEYKIYTYGPEDWMNKKKNVEINERNNIVEIEFDVPEKEGRYEIEWKIYRDLKLYADFNTTIKVVKPTVSAPEKNETVEKPSTTGITGLIIGKTLKSWWIVVIVVLIIVGIVVYKKRDHPKVKKVLDKIKNVWSRIRQKFKRSKKLEEFVDEEF